MRPRDPSKKHKCLECGTEVSGGGIVNHLKTWHQLSISQYREQHNIPSQSHNKEMVMDKAHAACVGRVPWNKKYADALVDITCAICGGHRKMKATDHASYTRKGLTRFSCSNPKCQSTLRGIRIREAKSTPEAKAKISATSKAMWSKNHDAHAAACLKGMRASTKYNSPQRMASALATTQAAPTKPELLVLNHLRSANLPFRYVGNGALFVEKLNPDFVSIGEHKIVILVQGCYWHGCKRCFPNGTNRALALPLMQATYARNGYSVLAIWEHELKSDEWKARLLQALGR